MIDLEGSVGEERRYGGEERPETVGRGKGVVEAEIVEKTGICAVEEGTQLVGSNVVEGEGGEGEGGEGGRNEEDKDVVAGREAIELDGRQWV